MLYALNRSELQRLRNADWTAEFAGAEMLAAVFRTDPSILAKILPRPLRPPTNPLALVFITHYPQNSFATVYNEAELFVQAEYRGRLGMYCLSMAVADDMAMAGGREVFGYPKKMAELISLETVDSKVIGSAVRKETEILRIEAELKVKEGIETLAMIGVLDPSGARSFEVTAYMFKYFTTPSKRGFDYLPRLIAELIVMHPRMEVLFGDGTVTLSSSPFDQLGEGPMMKWSPALMAYTTTLC